jgi:hypothetical protein
MRSSLWNDSNGWRSRGIDLKSGVYIMSETIKPRPAARGGRRRASPGSAEVHGDTPVTLDVMVRLQAIALPEADGGFTVVIPALGCAT